MNIKHNRTEKCYTRVGFGHSHRIPIHNKENRRSKSRSSLKELKESDCKHILDKQKIFSQRTLKNPLSTNVNMLKSQFDELVNNLFIKIDFDCSGYITYTKISYCKEIS